MNAGCDGLTVSVSQLKQFIRCPRQYELQRVLGVEPAFVPLPLAFGSAIHHALAAYYEHQQRTETTMPFDELTAAFRDSWKRIAEGPSPVRLDEGDGSITDTGVGLLRAFHTKSRAAPPLEVTAIEMPFSGISLRDPRTGEVLEETLNGVIDLVVHDGGRQVLVEHKTAARRWSDEQLQLDFQVTAYKLAARVCGLGEVGLRYQVLTKTKVPGLQVEDVVRDDAAEVEFLTIAAGVLRAISAGAFWPNRVAWQCQSCPYSHACAERR